MTSPSISVTPAGHLLLAEHDDPELAVLPRLGQALRAAWEAGAPDGLLHLGLSEPETPLPAALGFWRDLAKGVVSAVCTTPGIEELRERVEIAADAAALGRAAAGAPPMEGGEYLDAALLARQHAEILDALRRQLRAAKGQTVAEFLAGHHER